MKGSPSKTPKVFSYWGTESRQVVAQKLGLSGKGNPISDTSSRHPRVLQTKTYREEETSREGRDPESVLSQSYVASGRII